MRTTKIKKLMSLILSLLMLFTMIPLSVSAETTDTTETTRTILDVAKKDEDGKYSLTGNVEVNATYEGVFTGTLNGNGYTVTTTVPLFKTVTDVTIENITVAGTVAGYAAVASLVTGENETTTFKNVTNAANVTNSETITEGSWENLVSEYVTSASLASFVYNTTAQFINCENSGSVTAQASGNITSPAGAIIGYASAATLVVNSCTNKGTINSNKMAAGMIGMLNNTHATVTGCDNSGAVTSKTTYAGGIVAYKQGSGRILIERCTNFGAVKGEGYVGGIFGYAKGNSPLTVQECGNTANITATGKPASDGSYIAGIIGFSDKTISQLTVKYCYNTGTITSPPGKCAAGIVGRMNFLSTSTGGSKSIVDGCYNSGTIIGTEGHTAQIFWATAEANKSVLGTNFYLNSSTPAYTANGTTYNALDGDGSKEFSESELTSGALAKNINDTVGETVYYQNINEDGATKDDHPVTNPTHGYVFKHTDNELYSLAFYTYNGGSVRLDGENSGLRFSTAVNKADYDLLASKGVTMSFGTLITPNDYLKVVLGGGYEFTKAGLANLNTENPYLDVTPTGEGTAVFMAPRGSNDEDNYYFHGSISGIKTQNYEWDYSAIGYVSINGTEVYSADYATTNIAYIANLALEDTSADYTDGEEAILRGYLLQD